MESIGAQLKAAREQKHMTVSEVASITNATRGVVEAIERDDFDFLPAPVYAKGFIKLYAECVELNPVMLNNMYEVYYKKSTQKIKTTAQQKKPQKQEDKSLIHFRWSRFTQAFSAIKQYKWKIAAFRIKKWIYTYWSKLKNCSLYPRILEWIRSLHFKHPVFSVGHLKLTIEEWKTILLIAAGCILLAAAITGLVSLSGKTREESAETPRLEEPPPPYLQLVPLDMK